MMKLPDIDGSRWMMDYTGDVIEGDFVELRDHHIAGPIYLSDFGGGMICEPSYKFAWNKRGQYWGGNDPLQKHPYDIVKVWRKNNGN